MPIEPLLVIGAGGHSKVVLDALALTTPRAVRLCDDDPRCVGQVVMNTVVEARPAIATQRGIPFHIAIGNALHRRSLQKALVEAGAIPTSVIHPAAVVSASAAIGAGSFVAARAVIAPDTGVGDSVIVNHGAIIDHDCEVGDFSHIAPNSTLCGGVRIGVAVLIGAGATILPGVHIGDAAIIAAGATIVRDVAPNEKVIFALARKN
ncbi:NeuD/PglB/VioB family sugar acetyltransferase [Roseomonas aeriglobus]|nr:NeuD/PglB/VioB family sugar acetyltransferase [Roseomonas aeriglobus]MBN2974463.1 NeuD/PglB/VioB family sugar acetyltransferase [Roseomonas aeriglobus]